MLAMNRRFTVFMLLTSFNAVDLITAQAISPTPTIISLFFPFPVDLDGRFNGTALAKVGYDGV